MANQDAVIKRAIDAVNQAKAEKNRLTEQDRRDLVAGLGEDIIDVLFPLLEQIAENSKINTKEIEAAIKAIKIDSPKMPTINIPKVDVKIPEIKIPEIKVPTVKIAAPKVTVKVPKVDAPIVNIPEVAFPDRMNVNIDGVDKKNPLSVILRDLAGKPIDFPTGIGGGKADFLTIKEIRGAVRTIQVRGSLQTAYVTENEIEEVTLLAGVSGVFHDLVMMKGSNESDAAITLDIRQTTGGTVQDTLVIPANSTAGVSIPIPIPQDHKDATWTVQNNAADNSNTIYSVTALFSIEE